MTQRTPTTTADTQPHAPELTSVPTNTFGARHADADTPPNMTSGDFGFILQEKPGTYVLIGNADPAGRAENLHHSGYDFNDAAIPHGIRYWVNLANAFLARSKEREISGAQ